MFLLKIRANRYLIDFHAPALLLTVLVAAGVVTAAPQLRSWMAWTIRIALGASAVLVVVFNVFAALQQFDGFRNTDPKTFSWMTRISAYPASWLRNAIGEPPGPVELQVVFNDPPKQARLEPLLTTGLPIYSDSVYAIRYPDNRVEFTVDHYGYGWPHSQVFSVVPGRKYTLKIGLGSLYPPAEDPYFTKWDRGQIALAKTTAKITFDGAIALNSRMRFYEAPPWSLTPGQNHTTYTGFARDFGGKITSFRRLGAQGISEFTPKSRSSGYFDLKLKFDRGSPGVTEPLLASGHTGSGNLLFVEVLANGQVRFGCDFWGFYAVRSQPVSIPLEPDHNVELFVGPLATDWPWPPDWNLNLNALEAQRRVVRIWVDGSVVWTIQLDHHLDSYEITELGTNSAGFSSAIDIYSAPLERLQSNARAKQSLHHPKLSSSCRESISRYPWPLNTSDDWPMIW